MILQIAQHLILRLAKPAVLICASVLAGFAAPIACAGSLAQDDLSELADLPGARLFEARPASFHERVYPLSAIRRISNKLRMDQQLAVRGEVSSATYEFPTGYSALQAFDAVSAQLPAEAEVLFSCSNLACGSSSLLANQVFANAKLLGVDEQQHYLLARQTDANAKGGASLIAIYAITKGSRRTYAYVERMSPSTSDALATQPGAPAAP